MLANVLATRKGWNMRKLGKDKIMFNVIVVNRKQRYP